MLASTRDPLDYVSVELAEWILFLGLDGVGTKAGLANHIVAWSTGVLALK